MILHSGPVEPGPVLLELLHFYPVRKLDIVYFKVGLSPQGSSHSFFPCHALKF